MIEGEEQEELLNTLAETPQEEVRTIEEDIYVIGVESLNGQAGDLTLKSINGENLVGEGNIALQTPLNQAQLNAVNSGIDSTKVEQIATNAANITTLQNTKQDNLTQTQLNAVNSGIDATKVAQIATNTGNITSNTNRLTTIEGKIPSTATSSNQLTDKNYVDNAIATNTANYISDDGKPFQSYADLVAYSGPLTNNDYAFVETIDQAGNDIYTRYKYNADQDLWAEEYTITNPYFTSDQWASINSGIAANDVTQIGTNKTDIAGLQTSKQDTLTTAQQAAVDSGIDVIKVQQITTNATNIAALQTGKQDKLTAGTNIQINGTTISATDTKYTAGTGLTLTGTQFSVTEPVPSGFFTDTTTSQTSEGTDLIVNGTTEAPLKNVELKGNTFQQIYSGKNLFNIANVITNGTGLVNNGDGTLTVTTTAGDAAMSGAYPYTLANYCPTLKEGDVVTLSAVSTGTAKRIYLASASLLWNFGETKTITSSMLSSRVYWYASGVSTTATVSNVQLEIGSTPTAYEPYVGGVPSPNPDYPQDIQVVTGEQTVKVTGKNLFKTNRTLGAPSDTSQPNTTKRLFNFDEYVAGLTMNNYYAPTLVTSQSVSDNTISIEASSSGYGLGFPIETKPSTSYTVSFTTDSTANDIIRACFYKEDGSLLSWDTSANTPTEYRFSTPADCAFTILVFRPRVNTPTTYSNIMLVGGSTAATFEPFQGQTFPISLGTTELCKIGTYQDYIWKDGSDWKIHKEVGKAVLDGSEGYGLVSSSSSVFYVDNVAQDYAIENNTPVSDHFGGAANVAGNAGARQLPDNTMSFIATTTPARLYIRATQFNNVPNDFKTWLLTHNTAVYYVLATPTDTAITDETLIAQLEALWNATSYNPQTNITSTTPAPNLPTILTIDTFKNNWAGTLAGYQETIKRLEARVEDLEA